MIYVRFLAVLPGDAAPDALPLAGGIMRFSEVDVLSRTEPAMRLRVTDLPDDVISRLTAKRTEILGLTLEVPRIMGILNVTPDRFSARR